MHSGVTWACGRMIVNSGDLRKLRSPGNPGPPGIGVVLDGYAGPKISNQPHGRESHALAQLDGFAPAVQWEQLSIRSPVSLAVREDSK